jgi:hypothetical protein
VSNPFGAIYPGLRPGRKGRQTYALGRASNKRPRRGSGARLVGFLSLVSGGALILAPDKTSSMYGLPQRAKLVRWLGVRDVIIGAGLLAGGDQQRWWLARSAADAVDAVLIANSGGGRTRLDNLRAVAAAALSTAAALSARRTRRGLR